VGQDEQALRDGDFDALYGACRPTCRGATSSSRTATRAPTPSTGSGPGHHRDAWHSLFARNMFIRELDPEVLATTSRTSRHALPRTSTPIPERGRTNERGLHPARPSAASLVLIGGTSYAGEIKKSIFTVMNYLLPRGACSACTARPTSGPRRDDRGVLRPVRHRQDHAVGEADRALIGDDEHGWSDHGVFNFEGGCYAKVIRLSERPSPRSTRPPVASARCWRT
jgi:phosphoenolpyruvate carboxykinase (ATP)